MDDKAMNEISIGRDSEQCRRKPASCLDFNTDKMRETISAMVTVSVNIFILLLYFYVIRKFMSSKHRNIKLNDASSKHGNTRINSRRECLTILNSVAVTVCFTICYLPVHSIQPQII